jgi:hypothetical protein
MLDIMERIGCRQRKRLRRYDKDETSMGLCDGRNIAISMPDVLDHATGANPTVQQWKLPTKGDRFKSLSQDIKSLLKAHRKLGIHFGAIKMDQALKMNMPAWGHIGVAPPTYNKGRDECLANRHAADTIGDLVDTISERDTRLIEGRGHNDRSNCACAECAIDRQAGCDDPAKCCRTAKKLCLRSAESLTPGLRHRKTTSLSPTGESKRTTQQLRKSWSSNL